MRLIRTILGVTAVGSVAVFGGVQAFDDETTRDDDGTITEAGGLGAFVIRVGDCVQMPDELEVASVEGVPCGEPHDAEAYATFELRLPEFEAETVELAAGKGCLSRWEQAIGTSYADSMALDFVAMMPTEASWALSDREVTCFVVSVDRSPLTGSELG
jgi:hypothetical protein